MKNRRPLDHSSETSALIMYLYFTPRDIPTRKHCTLGCLIQCRVHHIKKFFLIESGNLKTEANDNPLLTPFGANTKLLCLEFLHPRCGSRKLMARCASQMKTQELSFLLVSAYYVIPFPFCLLLCSGFHFPFSLPSSPLFKYHSDNTQLVEHSLCFSCLFVFNSNYIPT